MESQIQLLFLFKRDGVSYAFPYSPDVADEFYLEGMSIYHRFSEKMPQCTSCIAHEMLHLFGAWDLYQSVQTTKAQEEQAKKKLEEHMFDLKKVLYEWMGVDIEKKEEQCSTGSQERYRVIRQTLDEAGKKMR